MNYEFIFLYLIIPSLEHPGPKHNVMLKPLIRELKEMWKGIEAYNMFKKHKFTLWVTYLWLVYDFLAYAFSLDGTFMAN